MADEIMAVGSNIIVRSGGDGRLYSVNPDGARRPVQVGASHDDGGGTPDQQEYAVYVLVAKWSYGPAFNARGELGIPLPDDFKGGQIPFTLVSFVTPDGDGFVYRKDDPPPLRGSRLPRWFLGWVKDNEGPPEGWYD